MNSVTLSRKLVAEFLGTALLLAVVVGSGIMAQNLSAGNTAIALLANTIATGAGLIALILMFGPLSGAHFNPAVSLIDVLQKNLTLPVFALYLVVQILGAFAGVAAAHWMFELPSFFASTHVRTGIAQWWSEGIATFGLIAVIISTSRSRPGVTPFAVAAYITAAYWFTSSTSFANPAVTLARAASDTFAGIRPADSLGFIAAQCSGAVLAYLVFNWLYPLPTSPAQESAES
ncbi:MIP/aquaporin family protein [Undibacterium cyanobacteriorum]|uniref:MIP/aquaporin family protein n=1 Tax=Undibacterium cyanobacteriorum TaxID=3073561 RepID=A0ABY9RNG5_9BURK|nr:MIP/aquaporin family protein [Undibacterium sp. 20NA77.5]WMW81536.1 MIP/aquaporin family protein [Undibacterium sp. 20NA77.5]